MSVRRLALVLLPLTLGGCARAFRSYDLAPNGLTRAEDGWRRMLAEGKGDTVAERIARGGDDVPADDLLRLMYIGAAAHYGGRYEESAQYLEAAQRLADERITKSASRSMLSLISNDGVLPYSPASTERMLIPYYAALDYIALGRIQDAAVEARRLAALLQAETDIEGDVRSSRAVLRAFTGTIFEAAGDANDARVAYRNAAALGASIDTTLKVSTDSGVVVVVLESGFVSHRVEQNLFVWLGADELHAFSSSGDDRARTASSVTTRVMSEAFGGGRRPWNDRRDFHIALPPEQRISRRHADVCRDDRSNDGRGTDSRPRPPRNAAADRDRDVPPAAPSIADVLKRAPASGRVTADKDAKEPKETKETRDSVVAVADAPAALNAGQPHTCDDDENDVPYLLKVAWPVYARPAQAGGAAFVLAGADTVARTSFADLSSAVVNDYREQLPLVVARTVARGAAKAALTNAAKKKAERTDETLGKVIGALGNFGNVMLERADTRSWHLVPAGVAVVKLRVPAGSQPLRVLMGGRVLDLGTVDVTAGGTAFVSRRVF